MRIPSPIIRKIGVPTARLFVIDFSTKKRLEHLIGLFLMFVPLRAVLNCFPGTIGRLGIDEVMSKEIPLVVAFAIHIVRSR